MGLRLRVSGYNKKFNTVFIHEPKTAGTSMEAAPFVSGVGHRPYYEIRDEIGKEAWNNAFKFAFVRDPLDRFVSCFFHGYFSHRSEDFVDFVRGSTTWKDLDYGGTKHFLPQSDLICDEDGKLMVDFVGRYDRLDQDWATVCRRVGVPFKLPRLRNRNHLFYTQLYTSEMRKVVQNLYWRDYERLGVFFDSNDSTTDRSEDMDVWSKTQLIEHRWWGNCINTYAEEVKQQTYAEKMGLNQFFSEGMYHFPMSNRKVVDIGGGPVSLLLKCSNVQGTVVDPFRYPKWVRDRYLTAGIEVRNVKAEDFTETGWDEVWIYNLLEHVEDPAKVVANARRAGRVLRIFEWLGWLPNGPHRHMLTRSMLDEICGGSGTVETIDRPPGFRGQVYYGAFPQE